MDPASSQALRKLRMPNDYPIEIDVNDVNSLIQNGEDFLLVDVRELIEYQTASIGGAVLVPLGELQSSLGQLESHRNKRIVVHCHHGVRSLRAAMALRNLGFPGVQSMAGGIDQWSTDINPQVPRY
jgi:rhodanese-related sulfurtransferase